MMIRSTPHLARPTPYLDFGLHLVIPGVDRLQDNAVVPWLEVVDPNKVGTVHMKVQLIVVQGKPEGKTIPLAGPTFRIGRGDTCHLRPSNELVSREHAEFAVKGDRVTVRDMGSRNGTLVNGKVIATEVNLKDNDTVTVGNLTFAVSIQQDAKASAAAPAAAPAGKAKAIRSLDDVASDDIDSWLVGDSANGIPTSPAEVYRGETLTIDSFKASEKPQAKPAAAAPAPPPVAAKPAPVPPKPAPAPPKPAPAPVAKVKVEEEEETPVDDEIVDEYVEENQDEEEEEDDDDASPDEEFVDTSNPFYVPKKKAGEADAAPASKQMHGDTATAANDILRKMMERRRASKS
ncbi:FHA domain-containing protein [Isosphaeraceae bacterium EP7]